VTNSKGRRPPVDVSLAPEVYNTLMYTLDEFTQGADTDSWILEKALKLKNKIGYYGRVENKGAGEIVTLCFFENEAANLISLLLFKLYGVTPQDEFYFQHLQLQNAERKKRTAKPDT